MTKSTKIYFIVMLCIVVLCSIMGIVIRNSYIGYKTFAQMEERENLQGYTVQLEDTEGYDKFAVLIENYDDLAKASDLIIKVSATNERKMFPHTTTKTKVIVKEVWKGDVKKGQSIFIYEPASFSYNVSKCYNSIGGYQIMEEGKEYYMFLNKLKAAKGYKMSNKEKNTYLPSTALYSKFPVHEGTIKIVDNKRLNNDEYRYGEVQDMEIITSEQKFLLNYNKIKREALNRFGNRK